MQKQYQKVLNICKNEDSIANGQFYDLMYCNYENVDFNSTKQYAFIRKYKKETLLVVSNFDDSDADITVNLPKNVFDYLKIAEGDYKAKELISGTQTTICLSASNPVSLTIPANNGIVLKFNS